MHKIINNNFDAKVASSRENVMDIRSGKRGGFDGACMRFVEFLRHLALMLRHHSAIRHFSGSAQWTQSGNNPESGSPMESRQTSLTGNLTGQYADNWQGADYTTPATCQVQTLKRLKPATVVASLVTT